GQLEIVEQLARTQVPQPEPSNCAERSFVELARETTAQSQLRTVRRKRHAQHLFVPNRHGGDLRAQFQVSDLDASTRPRCYQGFAVAAECNGVGRSYLTQSIWQFLARDQVPPMRLSCSGERDQPAVVGGESNPVAASLERVQYLARDSLPHTHLKARVI